MARLVHDGDVVEIDAAVYKCDQSVRWTANDLTLIGVGGQPVLDASGCTITGRKGIWNPSGENLIVDNVAFIGAKGPDNNDAGIRYDGSGYLYITHSYFRDNQDGILYTPDKRHLATSNLVIDHSEFAHNGIESGQAHNMYITLCHSFVLRFSYSHGAIVGHEVKSRADATYILYNRLADEADGTSSYNIDIPQGGLTYIIGNVIQKSADAGNPANISYEVESEVNPVQKLYIAFNTIVESAPEMNDWHVLFIRDKGLAEARMVDNLIVGADEFSLLQGDGAHKVKLQGNLVTDHPGFADADHRIYTLSAGSPAIGHAVDPGTGSGFPLLPKYQFVFPHDGVPRPVGGKLNVGAYQYVPGQRFPPARWEKGQP